MTMYRKVPQCRICRSAVTADIDQDLVQRVTFATILNRYASHFTEDKPLTKAVVRNHWRHFREAVEVAAVQRAAPAPAAALAEHLLPQPPEGQKVFENAVRTRINEIEVLEDLVVSGLDDLKRIGPQDGETEFAVLNRDRVRRNTASIVMDSAKVKQMAVQADEDRHRLEKGRVVFRMFQLFARSLETCPVEYRSLVSTQLKEIIRSDDEINALLKEQASRPAVPEGSGRE